MGKYFRHQYDPLFPPPYKTGKNSSRIPHKVCHLSSFAVRVSDSRYGQHLPNETSSQPKHTSTDPSPLINQVTEQEMEKLSNSSKSPTIQKNQWDGNRLLLPTRLAVLLRRKARLDLPTNGYLSWRPILGRGYPIRSCLGN